MGCRRQGLRWQQDGRVLGGGEQGRAVGHVAGALAQRLDGPAGPGVGVSCEVGAQRGPERQSDSHRVCVRGFSLPAVCGIPHFKDRVFGWNGPHKKARGRSPGLTFPCGSEEEEILCGRSGSNHGVSPPNVGPTKERRGRRFALNREPRCSRSRPELTEVCGDPVLEELMRFSAHDALPPYLPVCGPDQAPWRALGETLAQKYHAVLTRLGNFCPERRKSRLELAN